MNYRTAIHDQPLSLLGQANANGFIMRDELVALTDVGLSETQIAAYLAISVDDLARLRCEFALEGNPFEQRAGNLPQTEIQLREMASALTAAAAWIRAELMCEPCGSTAFCILANAAAQIDRAHQAFQELRSLVTIPQKRHSVRRS